MDKNRIQKFLSSTRVLQFVFFVAAVTLVTYFFPREGKFRYTFQEGKPWKYGLLTAPFDFPVYKDEAVIQQERDSIMLDFQPVFSHNKSIEKKSVDDFEKALSNYTEMSIPPTLRKNLVQALREAYRKGIVSSEAYTHCNPENSRKYESSKTMSRAKYRYPNCNLHGKPTKTCSINSPTPTRITSYKPVT